jgi:hypothetical protein
MAAKRLWCLVIWLALVLALPWGPAWGQSRGVKERLGNIKVQLKVQAITKENFYLGEVWVAPPKFTDVQMGEQYWGDARAVTFDHLGNTVDLSASWHPSDPTMVAVSPDKGHRIKFTILKAGQSILRVTVGRLSRQLTINAAYQDGALHVEILQ